MWWVSELQPAGGVARVATNSLGRRGRGGGKRGGRRGWSVRSAWGRVRRSFWANACGLADDQEHDAQDDAATPLQNGALFEERASHDGFSPEQEDHPHSPPRRVKDAILFDVVWQKPFHGTDQSSDCPDSNRKHGDDAADPLENLVIQSALCRLSEVPGTHQEKRQNLRCVPSVEMQAREPGDQDDHPSSNDAPEHRRSEVVFLKFIPPFPEGVDGEQQDQCCQPSGESQRVDRPAGLVFFGRRLRVDLLLGFLAVALVVGGGRGALPVEDVGRGRSLRRVRRVQVLLRAAGAAEEGSKNDQTNHREQIANHERLLGPCQNG